MNGRPQSSGFGGQDHGPYGLTETSSQAVCALLEPGEECRPVQWPLSSTHKNIQRQDKPVVGVTGWER